MAREREQGVRYQLVVRGELDSRFGFLFGDMQMECEMGTTVLTGPVIDQGQLYGFLERMEELGLAAVALARGQDRRVRERYAAHHASEEKRTPRWQRVLREGNPWHTFAVGIVLSFPGVWYLAALDKLIKHGYARLVEVLVVV